MYKSLITLLCIAAVATGGARTVAAKDKDGDKGKSPANGRRKMARDKAGGARPGRRGPRGMWGGGRRGGRRRLTKEQEAELLKFLKEKRPSRYQWLLRMRDNDEREYRRAMSRLWWWYLQLRDKPKAVQDAMGSVAEARLRQHELRWAIQRAGNSQDKQRLVAELRQAVRKAFEARQVVKEHRLTELEREIQRIRADLKDRARRKEQIVSERLEKLLANPPRRRGGPGRHRRGRPTTRPAR